MIDLHTHILPGIDDGVKSDEEAIAFARAASDDGVRTIVATPHCKEGFFFNDRPLVLEHVRRLRGLLVDAGIDLELLPGAEVHVCPDLVQRVADGRAPTLNDNGRTLLLELSLSQYPVDLENLIFRLKLAGLDVLLAHPERIRFFQDDISRYASCVNLGAWGQITTGSLLGLFGSDTAEFSRELMIKGWVHVLASDAHNLRGRPPLLSEALRLCEELVGTERARAMVTAAPRALVDGKEPELPPVVRPGRAGGRSLLQRWLGRLVGIS